MAGQPKTTSSARPLDREKLPKYVRGCNNQGGKWTLTLWKPEELRSHGRAKATVLPYFCKSWRCPGPCRRYKASQMFARIKSAVEGHEPAEVAYMVLTVDRKDYFGDTHAYVQLYRAWTVLRKRLIRMLGPFDYVITVERHVDGWPHLNIMLVGEPWRACQGDGWRKLRHQIKRHVMESGFGLRIWLEGARSAEALSGYFVKMARNLDDHPDDELDSTIKEAVKESQLPVNAPPHFRRLRSSVRFLPPPHPSQVDWTGVLFNADRGVLYNMPEGYDIDQKLGEIFKRQPVERVQTPPAPSWLVFGSVSGQLREYLWIDDAQTLERTRADALEWKTKSGVDFAHTKEGTVWVAAAHGGWFGHVGEKRSGPWRTRKRARANAAELYGRAWLARGPSESIGAPAGLQKNMLDAHC